MFGTQEEKKPMQIKPDPEFAPGTIPVHTMQDDLDMLSGKVKSPVPAMAEETKINIPSAADQGPNAGVKAVPKPNSPFAQNPFPSGAPVAQVPPKAAPQEAMAAKGPSESGNAGKILAIAVFILVVLGSFGGGYYFYMTRYNNPPEEVIIAPPVVVPVEVPEEPVIAEKFSADKPNYLMLDVEKLSAKDIQDLFLQKTVEIREDGKTAPVEFLVTDSNNNPIAFKIFARLLGINLSPALLGNLQDDFFLYVYSDGGKARLGLSMTSKDPAKLSSDMKAEEKSLVKNLNPLFLGESVKKSAGPFSDNQYKGFSIRYLNLNDQNNLSVDYFVNKGQVTLATSKNATWAIIDRMQKIGTE